MSFVHFLGESMRPLLAFEIYWPLVDVTSVFSDTSNFKIPIPGPSYILPSRWLASWHQVYSATPVIILHFSRAKARSLAWQMRGFTAWNHIFHFARLDFGGIHKLRWQDEVGGWYSKCQWYADFHPNIVREFRHKCQQG